MDIATILSHVDHTLLKPEATWDQIKTLCDEAMEFGCASVCIPPAWVKPAPHNPPPVTLTVGRGKHPSGTGVLLSSKSPTGLGLICSGICE